jgi:membrane protease YdiL (CAAX protease family)
LINGAVLLGCAVFDFAWKNTILVALMLFLPFIDRQWSIPRIRTYNNQRLFWFLFLTAIVIIFLFNTNQLNFILYTLLLVALPEEWFFRAYFLTRMKRLFSNNWTANIVTSALFAIMHVPAQGWFGLSVFIPSLILGWLYQQRQDIVLVTLLHALSNIVYMVYLQGIIVNWY